ncbi:MAG: adenine-specific DNA-methyltransferase [Acidobacteriota bacterium]|nr:adenine-specific DNA-methyltransferase [Acidobacteriota bacterium]
MENQFCLVGKDFFLDKTSFLLTPGNKYLLAILNSHVTRFFLDTLVSKMRGGYFSMSKIYVEQIPIPRISKEAQLPFESLVDMIMFARGHGMNSDASTLEWVIDGMTYGLYFEPEMKKSHCYINDRIAQFIRPFKSVDTDDFKTEYIQTFVKFCDKDDTIRHGLVHSRLVKPVQIIQGDKK